jgi:hypothetical protein
MLTIPQPKEIKNFSKNLTLKGRTAEAAGEKGFCVVVFS